VNVAGGPVWSLLRHRGRSAPRRLRSRFTQGSAGNSLLAPRAAKRGKGADGGVDIIAHKDELGFEPPIVKVQVKSTEGKSGDQEVTALYGKCNPDEKALFITLGEFTNQAENFARNKPNLRLIRGDELVGLVFLHYEKFDSRYKGLLPLKRVYIPDPEETEA